MVYTIKARRWKYPVIILSWGGVVVAAPAEWDWVIGRNTGYLYWWVLQHSYMRISVKES